MQEPIFKLTPEMEAEINDQIERVTTDGQDTHDAAGARPRSVSLRRRYVNMADSGSPTPRPENNPTMPADEDLLDQRHQTHGSFEDNAIISQAIKSFFRSGPGWNRLTDIEKEAMDMIALKFSRILSGKSMSKQHWEDVVGYAKLVEEKCF